MTMPMRDPHKTCPSVRVIRTGGFSQRQYTVHVQCQVQGSHDRHFAAWGGSQAWNQIGWVDGDDGVTLLDQIPKKVRVR